MWQARHTLIQDPLAATQIYSDLQRHQNISHIQSEHFLQRHHQQSEHRRLLVDLLPAKSHSKIRSIEEFSINVTVSSNQNPPRKDWILGCHQIKGRRLQNVSTIKCENIVPCLSDCLASFK
jgi:hypothetical protein